jgi:hypothetical protein
VPGANGSDGALNVVAGTTTIDLSLAPSAAWDSVSAAPGKGVYDGSKWAVVFHYTSVNIATGATVAFKNNASRAPVVWLVDGDVTINGTLDLNGGAFSTSAPLSEPGPGGFGGGKPVLTTGAFAGQNGPGWGLGGGGKGFNSAGYNGVGAGVLPGQAYGSAQLLPLIGGSGAGGTYSAGGAGGGAILIAATGTINVGGTVHANGGAGSGSGGAAGSSSGSGGAIRLVADTVTGSGTVTALGGTVGYVGATGRIRIEGNTVGAALSTNPLPSAARPASPVTVWLPDTAPAVRIVSVGGQPAPADPQGQLNAAADTLPDIQAATLAVVIETRNVALTSQVNVHVTPLVGDAATVAATYASGNASLATWTANISLPPGSSGLQVRVEP